MLFIWVIREDYVMSIPMRPIDYLGLLLLLLLCCCVGRKGRKLGLFHSTHIHKHRQIVSVWILKCQDSGFNHIKNNNVINYQYMFHLSYAFVLVVLPPSYRLDEYKNSNWIVNFWFVLTIADAHFGLALLFECFLHVSLLSTVPKIQVFT